MQLNPPGLQGRQLACFIDQSSRPLALCVLSACTSVGVWEPGSLGKRRRSFGQSEVCWLSVVGCWFNVARKPGNQESRNLGMHVHYYLT